MMRLMCLPAGQLLFISPSNSFAHLSSIIDPKARPRVRIQRIVASPIIVISILGMVTVLRKSTLLYYVLSTKNLLTGVISRVLRFKNAAWLGLLGNLDWKSKMLQITKTITRHIFSFFTYDKMDLLSRVFACAAHAKSRVLNHSFTISFTLRVQESGNHRNFELCRRQKVSTGNE